jgi:hypothetical protein
LNLVDEILLKQRDVVFIQDIFSDDDAYNLYIGLKKNYAHFLYVPPAKKLNSLEDECLKGFLIASKYSINQIQFNTFQNDPTNFNEGFFDFIIENKNIALGHIYAAYLSQNNYEEKLNQITEKIQDDLATNEIGLIPFILFGGMNNPRISSELKDQLEEYFTPNENGPNSILLVKHITYFPKAEHRSSQNDCISNISTSNNRVIIQPLSHHRRPSKGKSNRSSTKEPQIISTKSKSENQDSQSEGKVGLDLKGTWGGTEGVQFSASVYGSYEDNNGNSIKVEVEQNSNGQGKVEISAEHSTDNGNHK